MVPLRIESFASAQRKQRLSGCSRYCSHLTFGPSVFPGIAPSVLGRVALRRAFLRGVIAGLDRVGFGHELVLFRLAVPAITFLVVDLRARIDPDHALLR